MTLPLHLDEFLWVLSVSGVPHLWRRTLQQPPFSCSNSAL